MKGRITTGAVLIVCAGILFSSFGGCFLQERDLDPFPAHIPSEMSLLNREYPPSYMLVTDTNLLAQAGITRNPDYITRRGDLEGFVKIGATASFLALYGADDTVRLVVKGVYFGDMEAAQKYADVQNTRQRLVMAYRRPTANGVWMLFIACDPELSYEQKELQSINDGLERYQRRLKLIPLFDQINGDDEE